MEPIDRTKAISKLRRQIAEIGKVKNQPRFNSDFKKWKRDTEVLISYTFGDKSRHLSDFTGIRFAPVSATGPTADFKRKTQYARGFDHAQAVLESMVDEVKNYWAPKKRIEPVTDEPATKNVAQGSKIFIVHGRDDGSKERVARFISTVGLQPIILHEQPNEGRTIIEKFETHSNVAFAVVILTPDDVGGLADDADNLRPRARQNVVFELGFFIGKLGRTRVAALHKERLELPSDYSGVVYIEFDTGSAWKFSLVKELKAAGFDVDANKAL
jgi:predicted nucleotide-binding protein